MYKKRYNRIINWTLKRKDKNLKDSVDITRLIFNNMGVALPQGNISEIAETLKSNDYMGWRTCTLEEAQTSANKGIAAIAINDDKIIVLAAEDEEEPVQETASVMTLSTNANTPSTMSYYAYNNGFTLNYASSTPLVKPYDPHYPYDNNFPDAETYYDYLSTYSYELRNDIVFNFTFAEVDSFRSYLVTTLYEDTTTQEKKQVISDIFAIAEEALSYIDVDWLQNIFSATSTTRVIAGLNNDSHQDDLRDITDCVEKFSHIVRGQTSIPKSTGITYKISLLKHSPTAGREIKIESSDGYKDMYSIKESVYDLVLATAIANAHYSVLYKIAPGWTYFREDRI